MEKLIIYLGVLIIGSLHTLQSQTSATATFTASATIIQPIGITTTSDLNFANIDAQGGGAVILTPENMRYATGDIALASGEEISAASFQVTGQPGLTYNIHFPSQAYTLSNGVEEMILENFTSSLGEVGLLAEGRQTFNLGATLNIKGGQTPGYYTSPTPMDVTVIYN
ncbi:MAG TPA: DUF4402 domain-containing protein [Gillisia sp.]|nr:DUF4402 domain-containing protein [Gillisia sp.]